MNDFLTRLVQRQTGGIPTVRPRTRSMFAPAMDGESPTLRNLPGVEHISSAEEARRPVTAQGQGADVIRPLPRVRDSRDAVDPTRDGAGTPRSEPQGGLRESLPGPQNIEPATVLNRPAHGAEAATLSNPMAELVSKHTPHHSSMPGRRDGQVPVQTRLHQEAPIDLPPRLVESSGEGRRPTASPLPSLLSGVMSVDDRERAALDSPEPPIQVTIGRIELTAVSSPAAPKRKAGPRQPSMSLEDYLARRHGGRP
ncbi:MAG: hypothetical protein H8K09_13525 [Nitrospira sp.]|jgi:hypothetical protein|nr:hypothetical protein [Nitrospira sp.]